MLIFFYTFGNSVKMQLMKKHSFYSILISLGLFTGALAQAPVMNSITGPLTVCSIPAAPGSYTASATNSPTSYSWYTVPYLGVNISNPTGAITSIDFPFTSASGTTYTVFCSATNGSGTSSQTAVVVNVFETPTVTFSGANSFCQGSSTSISASPTTISASSTISYNWTPSTGLSSTTGSSVIAMPASSTTYTVLYAIGSCTNSDQFAVSVNPTCTYVWPGDINNDGIANNLDILELGLHYTQTGPPRSFISNSWDGYNASIWTGTTSNGKNLNYSDCNGDGTINNGDTAAIFYNYGLTHQKSNAQASVNPLLTIIPDQSVLYSGTWGTSSVYLGNATNTITNINGLAFTVTFDQTLIESANFYIEYPTSFLNASNQNLTFSKLDQSNGMLYTAITHTNNTNISGMGKIAILHYKLSSTFTSNTLLNIGLTQAHQSDASGALSQLSSGSSTVAVSVGLHELIKSTGISMYPNPANQNITISSKTFLDKIEVLSVTGQLMMRENASGSVHLLDLANLTNGVYFISVYNKDNTVQREKIIVQH